MRKGPCLWVCGRLRLIENMGSTASAAEFRFYSALTICATPVKVHIFFCPSISSSGNHKVIIRVGELVNISRAAVACTKHVLRMLAKVQTLDLLMKMPTCIIGVTEFNSQLQFLTPISC